MVHDETIFLGRDPALRRGDDDGELAMSRHLMEATASELRLLAEELESLSGAPDALERAERLLWQTADRLIRESESLEDDRAGYGLLEPGPVVPVLIRIMQ